MIYTITLNPALDKTALVPNMALDGVNRMSSLRLDPGGKGINVSKVIHALGGQSVAVGLLAGRCGRQIADACTALGLTCDFTFTEGETRTNLKIVDPAAHTNTDINEPGIQADEAVLSGMLTRLLIRLTPRDIVVLSGSLPQGAAPTLYRSWTAACRSAGAKVFLDAERDNLRNALEAEPELVKPNRHELACLVGHELGTPEEAAAAGRSLLRGGTEKVVVSLGAEGALFLTPDAGLWAHGLRVEVGSTVGAGDAMVAALALCEERGMDLEQSVRLAVAASAANVMCSGTQAAERESVLALIPQVRFERLFV